MVNEREENPEMVPISNILSKKTNTTLRDKFLIYE